MTEVLVRRETFALKHTERMPLEDVANLAHLDGASQEISGTLGSWERQGRILCKGLAERMAFPTPRFQAANL